MNTDDLRDMRIGAEISGAMPAIEAEIEALQRQIISSVAKSVQDGTLTPELAQEKWMEFIAAMRVKQRLEQKVRLGTSKGLTMPVDMK